MAAVEVDGLTVRYREVTAVSGASFRAESGRITAVLGPNGAGKTTTMEVLEGFLSADAGRTSVLDLDPRADHAELSRRMGVMLQSGGVGPGVRVGEAVRHAAALYEKSLPAGDVIDRVGLTGKERRSWRQLSGGEQRRLALALALVGRPQVAFLDEPTTGVDPHGRQAIRQVIADLRGDGVTVLLNTHDLVEVETLADHVVILDRGTVVAAGSPAELMSREAIEEVRFSAPPGLDIEPLSTHLARVVAGSQQRPSGTTSGGESAGGTAGSAAVPVERAAGLPPGPARAGQLVVEAAPGEYVIHAHGTAPVVAALTAWLADHELALADLRVSRQRLEDVFLALTSADERPRDPG